METLLSGVLNQLGTSGIEKIASSTGINPDIAKNIITQAGPLLTAKMAKNAETDDGLDSLDRALNSHDAGVFTKMEDIVNPNIDTKGSKILGHILGKEKSEELASTLAEHNGLDNNTVKSILEMAAPLILGQLGQEKKNRGLDAGGIFDMLKSEKSATEKSGNNMYMDLATRFLDADNDGSVVDDLLGMASKFLNK